MMYKIDVDSLELWREHRGLNKPFAEWDSYKKDSFNKWCLEHKKHERIARLYKGSQYKNDDVDPVKAREFAETIIKYIDENKPLAVAMFEYEGGIFLESAEIGILEERIEEYVRKLYDDYFHKRFQDAMHYIKINNNHRYSDMYDINTGKVIGTK